MAGRTKEILFLACTRPAMRWGVPAEGFALNLFGTFIFGMVMGSPLWWGMFFIFHMPMRALASVNPNFFHELRMWMATKGANIGGVLMALPSRPARRPSEMASSV
jgi:type IV secretory pathway VirB3-like protein